MKWTQYGKRLLPLLLSLALLCSPGIISAAETYQVTEEQLSELETVFQTLKTQQEEQRTQIETLKEQLTLSETSIKESEMQLDEAKESLQKSEASRKQTEKRLKRQRTIWAILASVAVGAAISER